MSRSRQRPVSAGPESVELIEEAVHLLRLAPPGAWLIYYGGTVPFALGVLFFWAHVTWFAPTDAIVAWASLGLVALFTLMKVAHAEFCTRLLAQRLGSAPVAWTWSRLRRLAAVQFPLQAWGLLLLPVTLVLSVPFGWVYAYFQSASVMGDADDAGAQARTQAALWPGQNHLVLSILSLLALVAWANLAALFWLVPWLADRFLGLENLFGLPGRWFANTTFLASVTVLTWLAIDPLVKAVYTLRVFHGRARRTGEDVRVELRRVRRPKIALRAVVTLGLFVAIFGFTPRLHAAEATPPPATNAAELDHAIDGTLKGSDFQWRLRPPAPDENHAKEGPVMRFFRESAEMLAELMRSLGRSIGRAVDWLGQLFPSNRGDSTKPGSGLSTTTLGLLLVIFIVVAVVLIVVALVLMWKRTRAPAATLQARALAAVAPDLSDENTQAAQLPTDGWLALAREQMSRGEWRLALRALHLATLAQLAAEGLISLAKFKTNLDYEREVQRRALARKDVAARFAARRRAFEAAWYGRAQAGESDARDWLAELERTGAT